MMPKRRIAGTAMAVVLGSGLLGGGLLGGCSSSNGDVSCTLSVCTVTLDRGTEVATSVLGVKIKLVNVTGDQVTVDVGGNQVVVPTGGNEVQGGSLTIKVDKVTADQVILKISKA